MSLFSSFLYSFISLPPPPVTPWGSIAAQWRGQLQRPHGVKPATRRHTIGGFAWARTEGGHGGGPGQRPDLVQLAPQHAAARARGCHARKWGKVFFFFLFRVPQKKTRREVFRWPALSRIRFFFLFAYLSFIKCIRAY